MYLHSVALAFTNEINFTKLYFSFCREKEEQVLQKQAECCCRSFNLRPFVTQFQLRTKLLQQDVALSPSSSPSDSKTDGFLTFSCLVCLFVSFPICPFHCVGISVISHSVFVHEWVSQLHSFLCHPR